MSVDVVSLYNGCFVDERCAVFAVKIEKQILQTLLQASRYSQRKRIDFCASFRKAMKTLLSFGVQQERQLTEALLAEDPSLQQYMKFTILKFAQALVEENDGDHPEVESIQVTAIIPTVGQFLQAVYENLALKEAVAESLLKDVVAMRLVTTDCIRLALLRFVGRKQPPAPEPAAPPEASADWDIHPDDSISQVSVNAPAEPKPVSRAASAVSQSLFNQRVKERLNEMKEMVEDVAARNPSVAGTTATEPE